MGKKGKKVDVEKKAALTARKEAKVEKAASKRLNKGARIEGDDDAASDDNSENEDVDSNMDRLLRMYKQQDAADTKTCRLVPCDAFPFARANATFTLTSDTKKKDVAAYLFGGEFFDGASNVVSDQLFRFDLTTHKWKQIVAWVKSSPPPRCAHSTVYYNRALYVFGGEMATVSDYHHYKDVWKFDTVKLEWSEIRPTGGGTFPSARSGHAVAVWKHFMIIFGGFYEPSRGDLQPRWYNDIAVLDLQTETWLDMPHSKLSVRPEPRSACNAALVGENQDQWLLHGGFSKLPTKQVHSDDPDLPASETKVHTDAWILHLKPLLSGKPPIWERCTSSLSKAKQAEAAAVTANGRSGVRATSYNKNVLLFGGVVDKELLQHKVDSVFYNDLSMFQVEKRKFIPIRINSYPCALPPSEAVPNPGEANRGEDDFSEDDGGEEIQLEEDEDNQGTITTGWDLGKLRSSMFAFIDGSGNIVYERIEKKQNEEQSEEEKEPSKEESRAGTSTISKRHNELTPDVIINRREPLPRIKCCLFVHGNTLFVYGGLLEVGDREVTLDDMWCIDLRKKRYWECVFAGTMHKQVWRGALHDDDESYFSSSAKHGDEQNPHLSESDNEEEEEKENPEKKRKSRKMEVAELIEKYELEDSDRTPLPDESLADFYARTSNYWNETASSGSADAKPLSTKDLKREGFGLAQMRFEEVDPIIARIMKLKLQREEKKERKAEKKESKKSKKCSNNR